MYSLIKEYLFGLIDSLNSFKIIFQLYENKETRLIYMRLVIYNILLSYLSLILFTTYYQYIKSNYSNLILIDYCLYLNYLIFNLFWNIPNYIISLVYNGFYTNELIKCYISHNYDENTKLKYKCYEKISVYLINKCYYQIIIIFMLIETIIVSYIPKIGFLIDWLFTSLVYSYYAWEYSWSSYKVPHNKRYEIFESNWIYYLGYGTIFGFIKISYRYLTSYYIISIIFPIIGINTLYIYHPNKLVIKSSNIKLPIFKLPIIYTDKIINWLSDYLIKRFDITPTDI